MPLRAAVKHVHSATPSRVLGLVLVWLIFVKDSDVHRHRVDCDDFCGIVHLRTTTPTIIEHCIRLEQPVILVQNLEVRRHEDCHRVVSAGRLVHGTRSVCCVCCVSWCTRCVRLVVPEVWAVGCLWAVGWARTGLLGSLAVPAGRAQC